MLYIVSCSLVKKLLFTHSQFYLLTDIINVSHKIVMSAYNPPCKYSIQTFQNTFELSFQKQGRSTQFYLITDIINVSHKIATSRT